MTDWLPYPEDDGLAHTVDGRVLRLPSLASPQLGNERDLFVHLPPSYDASPERRYPVLYMQDGQNLFDDAIAFAGEWGVDRSLVAAGDEGREAIVVAIPNRGEERFAEYCPFDDATHGPGRGARYAAFVTETIKPLVDGAFRTIPERDATGIMGSSMGALISLYAFFSHPMVFGFCGAMSPAVWPARGAMLRYIDGAMASTGRIYVDVGTGEGAKELRETRSLVRRLERKGYRRGDRLLFVSDRGAGHSEPHWGRRFRQAFEFFLDGVAGAGESRRAS